MRNCGDKFLKEIELSVYPPPLNLTILYKPSDLSDGLMPRLYRALRSVMYHILRIFTPFDYSSELRIDFFKS